MAFENLLGAGPGSTVTGPDAFGDAEAVGTSEFFAREDHDHGLPAAPGGGPLATANEVEITPVSTPVTVLTSTPATPGNVLVAVYLRVITAPTVVTLTITWTDLSGLQTYDVLADITEDVGSYSLPGYLVAVDGLNPVSVVVTAGTDAQVYASATFLQG